MAQLIVMSAIQLILHILDRIRYMFYLVLPSECMQSQLSAVPRYVVEMFPIFVSIAVVENAVRLLKGKSILRMNDTIASLSQGIFQECVRLNIRSIELLVYCFVYDNFRITTLAWDSALTWWFCLIAIDSGFYWAHRLAHEVNIIWAIHQAHHSAEDFTMMSGLRQAVLQPFTAWITYVPLALTGIPPPIFLAHLQLGELYMLWLHTEVIKTLGPLEFIFNSPSHHRVHHARNRKYIDKNYAGVFIIWDRLFGTFEPEDPNEPVVYGLVHPVQSYNPFYLQMHHWAVIIRSMYHTNGWKNKLLIPIKGPGWAPGKPRLGYLDDIPEIAEPVTYWNPQIPIIQKLYSMWHFGIILLFYHELTLRHHQLNQITISLCIISLLVSITSIGFLFENKLDKFINNKSERIIAHLIICGKPFIYLIAVLNATEFLLLQQKYALQFEFLRCLLFFVAEQQLTDITEPMLNMGQYRYIMICVLKSTFLISAIACALLELNNFSHKIKTYRKLKSI